MSHALTPLADRVIATREEAATRTASGLYLPDSAKEKAIVAVIEVVGPEVKSLKAGDRVVYKNIQSLKSKLITKSS